jgi:hypothetical protein
MYLKYARRATTASMELRKITPTQAMLVKAIRSILVAVVKKDITAQLGL